MNAVDAQHAAMTALNGQVMAQSSMLNFQQSAWLFVLIVFVTVSPAILLLKRPKGHSEMPADAH